MKVSNVAKGTWKWLFRQRSVVLSQKSQDSVSAESQQRIEVTVSNKVTPSSFDTLYCTCTGWHINLSVQVIAARRENVRTLLMCGAQPQSQLSSALNSKPLTLETQTLGGLQMRFLTGNLITPLCLCIACARRSANGAIFSAFAGLRFSLGCAHICNYCRVGICFTC